MKTIVWKDQAGQYQYGENAYVGKIRIGSVEHDGTRGRDEERKQIASFILPGIKTSRQHFKELSEAKMFVQECFDLWLLMFEFSDQIKVKI